MTAATCTVNASSTLNGVNVTAATTPTIALADVSGVTTWSLACIGTDDISSLSTINASLAINQTNKTATYTHPAVGSAVIFRSVVNGGVDINGRTVAAYMTTFAVFALSASSLRLAAINETTEGDSVYGWTSKFNTWARLIDTFAFSSGAAITFSASLAPNQIKQTTQTSNVATNNLILQPQAPFSTATGANRTPGNFVVALSNPTNGGTTYPYFQVTQAGTAFVSAGNYAGSGTLGAYWAGSAAPTLTNFAFLGDGTSQSWLNVPGGGTNFITIGGSPSTGINVTSTTINAFTPSFIWDTTVAAPTIKQADNTTNSATGQTTTIQAQNATGTTANGGFLDLLSGTGTSVAGSIRLRTGGTTKLSVSPTVINVAASQLELTRATAAYGTTTVMDFNLGNIQQVTMTGPITTLTLSNMKDGSIYHLVFIQDGTGSRVLTLPGTMKPTGGTFTLTTTASKRDTFTGWSDGTNIYEISRGMNV